MTSRSYLCFHSCSINQVYWGNHSLLKRNIAVVILPSQYGIVLLGPDYQTFFEFSQF